MYNIEWFPELQEEMKMEWWINWLRIVHLVANQEREMNLEVEALNRNTKA